jgi:branched-chain amino acid transport system substrate-binding protein
LVLAACGDDDAEDSPSATTVAPATTGGSTGSSAGASTTAASETSTASSAPAGSAGSTGGSGAAHSSLAPVKIGYVNEEVGTPSFPEGSASVTAAVEYVNAELGGVDGHPLEVVTCAVGTDEESNQKCGQQFANDSSITAVVGGLLFNGGPLYTALEAAGIPFVGMVPLTGADQQASNAHFWSAGSLVAVSMGKLAAEVSENPTKIGVLYSDDAAGNTAGKLVEEGVGDSIETIGAAVDQASGDVLGPIGSLGDVDAYVVLVSSACLQVAQNLATTAPDTPVVTTASCLDPRFLADSNGAMDGWYTASPSQLTNVPAGSSEDIDLFREKFPKYGDPALVDARYTGSNWGMIVTLQGILDEIGADSITKDSIAAALDSFTGPVDVGVENIACPGTVYPSVCAAEVLGYQQDGDVASPLAGDQRLISTDPA